MNKSHPSAEAGKVEILTEWEGNAETAPGVLFEETQADSPGVELNVAALAGWIAVTALSGAIGNHTHEAIKKKVLGVLSSVRRRFGQPRIDEVKQELFRQMQKYRTNGKITDKELRERIDLLFDEI